MPVLLAIPVFSIVTLVHRYLQTYAPSNALVRHVRAQPSTHASVICLLALAGAFLVAMDAIADAVARGAAGWLNLVVLLLAWDAIKIGLLAVSVGLRICLLTVASRWLPVLATLLVWSGTRITWLRGVATRACMATVAAGVDGQRVPPCETTSGPMECQHR